MHCRSCGAALNPKAEICVSCGVRPLNGTNFCQECGASTKENQEICTSCGSRLLSVNQGYVFGSSTDLVYPAKPPKSPGTAVLLSCLLSGGGQIYLGQVTKGIVIILVALFLGVFSYGGLTLAINILSMIDANAIGKKLLDGRPVGQWEFF